MKKMVIFLTALAMIAGFSTASFASVADGAHNLGDNGFGTTEICIFCHTPHNTTATEGPLWNRADNLTQTYALYGTGSSAATGVTSLCLSCHDGTTNVDAFGGAAGTALIQSINTAANVGTDLSNDHPVMIAYPSDWATTGDFNDPAGLTGVDTPELFANQVECASCHNPHEETVHGGYFLRAANDTSQMCLACHNK